MYRVTSCHDVSISIQTIARTHSSDRSTEPARSAQRMHGSARAAPQREQSAESDQSERRRLGNDERKAVVIEEDRAGAGRAFVQLKANKSDAGRHRARKRTVLPGVKR